MWSQYCKKLQLAKRKDENSKLPKMVSRWTKHCNDFTSYILLSNCMSCVLLLVSIDPRQSSAVQSVHLIWIQDRSIRIGRPRCKNTKSSKWQFGSVSFVIDESNLKGERSRQKFWLGGAAPQTLQFLAGGLSRPPLKRSFVTFDRGGQTGPPRSNDFFSAPLTIRAPPTSTVRKPPKMTPIGMKLWENACQTIPDIWFSTSKQKKWRKCSMKVFVKKKFVGKSTNCLFLRSYGLLDVIGRYAFKSYPQSLEFQLSTTFGGGVKEIVSIFAPDFRPKMASRLLVFWLEDTCPG